MDMWNSLAGYVMIKIEGAGLERFINRAIREGLEVWNIARSGRNTMTACVSIGSFYALRRLNRSLSPTPNLHQSPILNPIAVKAVPAAVLQLLTVPRSWTLKTVK